MANLNVLSYDNLPNKYAPSYKTTMIDLTGQIFGRLLVQYPHKRNNPKIVYWVCKCNCGNYTSVATKHLKSGKIQSCGCLQKERITEVNSKNISGQTFGYLTAIEKIKVNSHRESVWKCKCNKCGSIKEAAIGILMNGNIKSCGCLSRSYGEQRVFDFLTNKNINFICEYSFDNLIDRYPLRFDFCILNKKSNPIGLIEVNGEQHYNSTSYFYSYKIPIHDNMKKEFCTNNKIPLLIIPYINIKRDQIIGLEDFINDIANQLP